jgi:hypothetical protein
LAGFTLIDLVGVNGVVDLLPNLSTWWDERGRKEVDT